MLDEAYRWIAMHRVHSSPLYVELFCRSACLYFSHRCKCSCRCVGVGRLVCECIHTYMFGTMQRNWTWGKKGANCTLTTTHVSNWPTHVCMQTPIMGSDEKRFDLPYHYHMTAIQTQFDSAIGSVWDTYMYEICTHYMHTPSVRQVANCSVKSNWWTLST